MTPGRPRVARTRAAYLSDSWLGRAAHDLFRVVVDRLPVREDRDLEAPLFPIGSADNLRLAIGRACRDAGVPTFSPHSLRDRRVSLAHPRRFVGRDRSPCGTAQPLGYG